MYAVWHGWDPRALVFFVVMLLLSDAFLQMRWRFGIVCKNCGFDPVLYRKSPEMAAGRVKDFLAENRADPNYFRTRPLNLPFIAKERLAAEKSSGSRLSKQV